MAIRKNPLDTSIKITEQGPECESGSSEPQSADPKTNGAPKDGKAVVAKNVEVEKVGQN